MRLIHTSDWHLGQTFHGFDRQLEHQLFLDWLLDQIVGEQPDVLLIAGDVFDTANPSATAQKQLYHFVTQAKQSKPNLQIIMIAGNHDSAGRIEAPSPLLQVMGIDVIGTVKRDVSGEIDVSTLVFPLRNHSGETSGWCLALPFLRPGDLPKIPDSTDQYTDGVTELYRRALNHALELRGEANQPIVGMGHLHLTGGVTSELSERRLIVGGNEALPASIFGSELAYVALGHLHKAQRVGAEHIRYCGSPLPMSFSEVNYQHQALRIDFDGNTIRQIESLKIPRNVELLRIGATSDSSTLSVDKVLRQLMEMDLSPANPELQPFVEVSFVLEQPEPDLKHRVELALADKPVRLARIQTRTTSANQSNSGISTMHDMEQLTPEQVFQSLYARKYTDPMPDELRNAFSQIATQALHAETAQ
ncbi:exonuclease SbcCD subunit D C-terminal domain-containing protein [Shewanella sp.]|uniref:exonuclease SbcCD subunit D n=1 Tax=Shewanella sp. TaxID=50422 RepID=UPI001B60F942|nr:exonuclease SbcCD subunit D C-terminal domain-containing protein [Shewanella sp.]MBP6518382.1 exonuclease SbcCD subunit D C-terminal domain-containing protein [Shewanella sp.]